MRNATEVIEVMTREQWEELHNLEWRAEARKRQNYWNRKHAADKAEAIYYIKQKLSGLTMAAIGIITPIICDGDATFSLFALPLGIWIMFTKEKVMMF